MTLMATPIPRPREGADASPVRRAVLEAVTAGAVTSSPLSRAEVADVRRHLSDALAAGPAWSGGSLTLSAPLVERARRCPASTQEPPFAWDVGKARRRLGRRALSIMVRERAGSVVAAKTAAREELESASRLGAWLGALPPGGRGALLAAVSGWAASSYLAVPWEALAEPPRRVWFPERPIRCSPLPAAPEVVLEERSDAVVRLGPPGTTGRALLRLGPGRPENLAVAALAVTVATGWAPVRVVAADPATGTVVGLEVEVPRLLAAADHVVEAARALAVSGERPGEHCRACPRRTLCAPGRTWLAARPTWPGA